MKDADLQNKTALVPILKAIRQIGQPGYTWQLRPNVKLYTFETAQDEGCLVRDDVAVIYSTHCIRCTKPRALRYSQHEQFCMQRPHSPMAWGCARKLKR